MDWGTVIGVVVGAGAGVAGTYLQQRTALRREELAHARERRERARDFERDNLLALRDAIADAQEAVHEVGELAYRSAEAFEYPPELRGRIAKSQTAIAKYAECSSDEPVRTSGRAVRQALILVTTAGSAPFTIDENLEKAAAVAYESIGAQLQRLRDEDAAS